ncbi:MAG: SAM-dependent methyltransferase [Burkholderiales bacterium]
MDIKVGRSLGFVAPALVVAAGALAVPADRVSWTAAAVCELRALGAQHPDPKLRNGDFLATRLCNPVRLPREYEAARDVMDDNPEAHAGFFYVNARTRHIDSQLRQAIASGVTQVVILGAGFDSRAYRFHKSYPRLAFFEVDLPATISAKQAAVRRLFGALPGYVHYVPIDFDVQALDEVLAGAGYDAARLTLFILEGVTMYVSAAGNAATFDFIRLHSPSGSRVVFDYVLRRVVDGDYDGLYAASSEAKGVALVGEPFVTGWTPAEAQTFAQRHGLNVLEDLDALALTRRYLIGSNGKPDGRIPDGYRIVDAKVQ